MDNAILLWIQEVVRNPILNPIVTFITHLGDAGMIWMAVTAVLLVIPKTRKIGVCCFFGLLVMFIVNNLVIKNAVARIRPYEVIEGLERLVEKPVDYSFPSGHTSAGITAAYVIARMAKKKRYAIPAIILAVLIGLSRLYVGVHYPTDVMGGALLGLLYGELGYRIGCVVMDRAGKKKMEEQTAPKDVAEETEEKSNL